MKNIILCADDYGQNQAISQGIIALFKLNRLSATSCLTTSPQWPLYATWLEPYKNQFDIGLHFNLTEGNPLSTAFAHGFSSVTKLLLNAHCRRLNQAAITLEFNAQLDHFIGALGALPDFIDGHQHIHLFPMIREVILDIYRKRLRPETYIRSVSQPLRHRTMKSTIIQWAGALHFKKLLVKNNIRHNTSFSGIYDFRESTDYAELFPTFLSNSCDQGLIMCHPSTHHPRDETDTIASARLKEYQYFLSEKFLDDCQQAHVVLMARQSKKIT